MVLNLIHFLEKSFNVVRAKNPLFFGKSGRKGIKKEFKNYFLFNKR